MILAVSGVPRVGNVSYTADTVAQVLQNGGMPTIETIVWDDIAREGSAPSCHLLLKKCAADYPGEDILLIEDDIRVCRNAVLRASELAFPADCEMLSLYNNRRRFTATLGNVDVDDYFHECTQIVSTMPPVAGIYFTPADGNFCYAQALKLSGRLVADISTREWPTDEMVGIDWRDRTVMSPFSIRDRVLGYFAGLISKRIGYVVPNWAQHIGDVSAVVNPDWNPYDRCKAVSAGNFISLEHDAMTDDLTCHYPTFPERRA
jgi:hypothetical protein